MTVDRWTTRRANLDARFWDRADRSGGENACWPWIGSRQTPSPDGTGGYGIFMRHGKTLYAHRRALEFSLGRPIADDYMACHTCDNPPCVNPSHLFEGTARDNALDAVAKGRIWAFRTWGCPDCGAPQSAVVRATGARCSACTKAILRGRRRRYYEQVDSQPDYRPTRTPERDRTHCKRGHEFTPENSYLEPRPWGHNRICRACRLLRTRSPGRRIGAFA